ncbi:GNAT family N-acetyltransferase [Salipiger sp. IMCC34102]|uniref:GNAT family N-acetyltransferase n=1 Tax=Salipiger sp. IMCC34102 TaxID=2510647 RepID=UPI00101B64F4|nr:GNAT family N-acetyltransferase [Salipiger sp. IMCC34102]RYH03836.1 GNAT family N-acetyltransferase [Salipiger sp. IMCC34102]
MTPETLAQTHAAANSTDRAWSAEEFTALLSSPGALLAGDERAFALGRCIAGELEVLTVACHPDHRRQGLSRAAVAALIERAGAERCFLEVAEDNVAARALYHALGFTQIGRRRAYYRRETGAAIDALVLSCP